MKSCDRARIGRFVRFNSVGLVGFAVHLGTLALLAQGFEVHYLVATVIAVEAAVLHNFLWHQHWTWRERPVASAYEGVLRLLKFHAANGLVSLVGNGTLMGVFVGRLQLPLLVAALLSIALCGLLNFLCSDRWVFRVSDRGISS